MANKMMMMNNLTAQAPLISTSCQMYMLCNKSTAMLTWYSLLYDF